LFSKLRRNPDYITSMLSRKSACDVTGGIRRQHSANDDVFSMVTSPAETSHGNSSPFFHATSQSCCRNCM